MNNDLCFVELFGSIAPIARHTGKQKDSSFCIASFVPLQSSLPTYTLFEMHLHPIAALHRTSPYLGRPQKREYFSISRSSVLEVQEKFWQTIEKFKHGAYKNILAILNIEKTLGTSLAEQYPGEDWGRDCLKMTRKIITIFHSERRSVLRNLQCYRRYPGK